MASAEPIEPFVKAVFERTWAVFRQHALVMVLASLLVTVIGVVTFGIAFGPLTVGFVELVRRAERNEPVQATDVFQGFSRFVPSFLAGVVLAIAITVGMIFLIIPGLIIMLFTLFTFPALAYENLGAFDAISRSVLVVRDNLVNALVLFVLISVLQSVGGSIILGLLLTTPLAMMALSIGYERMTGVDMLQPAIVTPPAQRWPEDGSRAG